VVIVGVAFAGIVTAASTRILSYHSMRSTEYATVALMQLVGEAQQRFRTAGGEGGYATDLESLRTPCPGQTQAALSDVAVKALGSARYELLVRPRAGSAFAGVDCHGRQTARDFYLSARPRVTGVDGERAMAMTASGRIFLFFDGIPPREADMTAGGLATPLDSLETLKIP